MSLQKLISHKSVRLLIAACAVVAVLAAVLAWQTGFDRAAVESYWSQSKILMEQHPWVVFVALVVLPGLPFPVSALLIAAGVVWHDHPAWACGLSLLALALNMTWTYWLAAGPARRLIERLVKLMGLRLPELPRRNHLRLILILRLTPGIPLFLQNYLLGIMRPPFRLYLPLSVLLNGMYTVGIVLGSAGATDGRFTTALSGVALVVVAVTLTKWLRAWLERRNTPAEADPAAEI